ncbi:hypothetical protein, partial [Marinobacter halotolerans]|uniref:hypothetical protein n=1 Tax=Marinobacter halotolerans TaxID=1569211 RepID=UPI001CD9B535
NSAVKQTSADGSVASAHVRVGHRQAPNTKNPSSDTDWGFLLPKRSPSLSSSDHLCFLSQRGV